MWLLEPLESREQRLETHSMLLFMNAKLSFYQWQSSVLEWKIFARKFFYYDPKHSLDWSIQGCQSAKETLFWWKFLLLEFSRCIRSICRSVSLYIAPSVEKTFRYCSQLTASCTQITRWGCDGNWGMGLWILVSTVAEPLPVSFSKFPCKIFHWSLKIK